MFNIFKKQSKKTDLQCVQRTHKLLLDYHAVHADNPEFIKQYRHLIQMELILEKETQNVR